VFFLQIDFPSVTFCGAGRLKKGIARGFASLYVDFLSKKNISLPFPADDFADRIRDVSRDIAKLEKLLINYKLIT
jgi:hypothetical protein